MNKVEKGITSFGTVLTFLKVGTCSETLCNVLNRAFGHSLELEEHATMHLAGGIMQHGYQCGLIWGATLAAGAQAYQLYGSGPKAETSAVIASQRLVKYFHTRYKDINCLELTDTEWQKPGQIFKYFIKGGTIRCFHMAAQYASEAFGEINRAFNGNQIKVPSSSVSCTAVLARKMGVSDLRRVMTAGWAGGIGLCGGACGALGAAIWLAGIQGSEAGSGKIDFKNPRAQDMIDRFLKCSDYEFECSQIVGRKFESMDDHAAYVGEGGCSEIIELLAAEVKSQRA